MLDNHFRTTLCRTNSALIEFYEHAAPDLMEYDLAEDEIVELLELSDSTQQHIERMLENVPTNFLDSHGVNDYQPQPGDGISGPIIHVQDLHLASSILIPLALELNASMPYGCYFPLRYLTEKAAILLGAMGLYCGWKERQSKYKGTIPHFNPTQSIEDFAEIQLLAPTARHLEQLFQNMESCCNMAKSPIEYTVGKTLSEI